MSCLRVASEICGSREIGRKARKSRERGLRCRQKVHCGTGWGSGPSVARAGSEGLGFFLSFCLSFFTLFSSLSPSFFPSSSFFFFLSQGLTNLRPAFTSLSSCSTPRVLPLKKATLPVLLEPQWLFLGQMEGRDREPPCKCKSRAPGDIMSVCPPGLYLLSSRGSVSMSSSLRLRWSVWAFIVST